MFFLFLNTDVSAELFERHFIGHRKRLADLISTALAAYEESARRFEPIGNEEMF